MQRGIIQLTKEEIYKIKNAFNWELNEKSVIGGKLKYVLETDKEVYDIEVSEDDLELLIDDIMPITTSNDVLKGAIEKVGNLLRQFRNSNS